MPEDIRIGRDLGGIAPVIVPLAAAHFGGSLLDGVVAIALPAAGEFVIASLLLPEMLGGDLSAKGFTAATALQAQTSGEGCFCRPSAGDRMSERPSGPSPAIDSLD